MAERITIERLERLLEDKVSAHKTWTHAHQYACELSSSDSLTERVRRDIMARKAMDERDAADGAYEDAVAAFVRHKAMPRD